ncbi:hypothetical protein [Calothrix sp. 336/3]|uniref:hypothetical protein n=1 Tax=Calothrix sp. 336/3 TaxID=1337936 RepID=UPI0004E3EA08|nr:hypothetical protein [Calothrix sp. 336/3]AKG23414.1 hypothetical protein IJ00_20950 [Calothrix sp. 336/3]
MSQSEFEKAKQRLHQAKQDILWALTVLESRDNHFYDSSLTPEQVTQLQAEFQQHLQEIHSVLEAKSEKVYREINFPLSSPREISPRITGRIPPFGDPDEEDE